MRKLFLFLSVIIFISLFLPVVSLAGSYINSAGQTITYDGFVPCGTTDNPCQFCHIFVMINGIWTWILWNIVTPIATLMIAVSGFYMLTASGDPGKVETGKKVLTATITGLVIILGAFLLVGFIFQAMGVQEWTNYTDWSTKGMFSFPCAL